MAPTLGLVGGICSGKSFVAEELRSLGAEILDADAAGHEALREPRVIEAAVERWGQAILDAQGQLVRRLIASIVFAPPPQGPIELSFLEKLSHPLIERRIRAQWNALRENGATRLIVLDAPVMFKAGWNSFCKCVVFVEASRAVRLDRARRRGWNEEDFNRREAVQESLAAKRRHADVILNNSGSRDSTIAQVRGIWEQLVGPIPA